MAREKYENDGVVGNKALDSVSAAVSGECPWLVAVFHVHAGQVHFTRFLSSKFPHADMPTAVRMLRQDLEREVEEAAAIVETPPTEPLPRAAVNPPIVSGLIDEQIRAGQLQYPLRHAPPECDPAMCDPLTRNGPWAEDACISDAVRAAGERVAQGDPVEDTLKLHPAAEDDVA